MLVSIYYSDNVVMLLSSFSTQKCWIFPTECWTLLTSSVMPEKKVLEMRSNVSNCMTAVHPRPSCISEEKLKICCSETADRLRLCNINIIFIFRKEVQSYNEKINFYISFIFLVNKLLNAGNKICYFLDFSSLILTASDLSALMRADIRD